MRLLRSARPSCARSAVLQCHVAPPPRWPNLPRAPLRRRASPTGLNRLCAVGPAAAASLGSTVAAHARVPRAPHAPPLLYVARCASRSGQLPRRCGPLQGSSVVCHAAASPLKTRRPLRCRRPSVTGLADPEAKKKVDLLLLKNVETFLKNVHQQNVEY